jgi:hypothetical protein
MLRDPKAWLEPAQPNDRSLRPVADVHILLLRLLFLVLTMDIRTDDRSLIEGVAIAAIN